MAWCTGGQGALLPTARQPAALRSLVATQLMALSTHYRARDRDTGEICALKKVCGRRWAGCLTSRVFG